jgi:hypothetical protein
VRSPEFKPQYSQKEKKKKKKKEESLIHYYQIRFISRMQECFCNQSSKPLIPNIPNKEMSGAEEIYLLMWYRNTMGRGKVNTSTHLQGKDVLKFKKRKNLGRDTLIIKQFRPSVTWESLSQL